MKIAFEYDTEKDSAELGKLQALVNALQPTEVENKKTKFESLLTPTVPKVTQIKKSENVKWSWGEQELTDGTKLIVHYPKESDWQALNSPHQQRRGYRIKDPKGNVHIIPNASSFARANNLDVVVFGNLAAGRRKEYKNWLCVQQDYWHIQPYLNIEKTAV